MLSVASLNHIKLYHSVNQKDMAFHCVQVGLGVNKHDGEREMSQCMHRGFNGYWSFNYEADWQDHQEAHDSQHSEHVRSIK